ncbi:MAG TPA: hypothetical protein VHX15_15705 [Frankiaceae bacterium]|jgi:hypothetical protein|nr:hypothetical protein [Frankiaceae bacterium]
MTATTFPALVPTDRANVRKALKGGVLIGASTATLPTALTSTSTPVLDTLTGFSSLGFISDSGAVVSDDESTSDVKAWGELYPVRRDVTSRTTTLKVTGLETNKMTLSTYFGVDPSTLTPDETTGELIIIDSTSSTPITFRVLVLSQDGPAGSEFWIGKLMPAASVTARGDQTFASGDDPVEYDYTFTAYEDAAAGFAVKTFYAGPGWLAGLSAMGLS